MRIFDTNIQQLKYMVLRETARRAFDDRLTESYLEIPKIIAPGPKPTMRCCVYKERAIAQERVHLAMGGGRENPGVIAVIPIACDECPVSGYGVTAFCRGCLAHRCEAACPRGAIHFDERQKARIDPAQCIGCGKCAAVCPYSAIQKHTRPCESACKVKAIAMDGNGVANINEKKCVACGACVYQCPFGAITDVSFLLDAIGLLRESARNQDVHVYALVAPSIASQFRYAKEGQILCALKKLGFYRVMEAALGADMAAWAEARELTERGFMLSSCCPAFVRLVESQFPKLRDALSRTPSPMAMLAARIKARDPGARVVFIGPCTAKKDEARREDVRSLVDVVLTFEELQALIDSRDFDVSALPEEAMNDASRFGRMFARSGGLSEALSEALAEQGSDFQLKSAVCDGIEACRAALFKAQKGALSENFIEGMACVGGCIGGAGCLTHEPKDASAVNRYALEAVKARVETRGTT